MFLLKIRKNLYKKEVFTDNSLNIYSPPIRSVIFHTYSPAHLFGRLDELVYQILSHT